MPQTLLSSDKDSLKDSKHEEDKQEENKLLYKGAFDEFDWNKNGTIPTRVKHLTKFAIFSCVAYLGSSVRHEKSRAESH